MTTGMQERGRRFNSRLREEATRGRARGATWRHVSTHASVRRRPAELCTPPTRSKRFNSRLREEATAGAQAAAAAAPGFNSRLREEATPKLIAALAIAPFQLTPP